MNIFKNLKNSVLCSLNAITFIVICLWYSLLEVPWQRIHNAIAIAMSIGVAFSNKVMDTRDWHSQQGVPPKYDVDSSVQCGRSMIEMLGVLAIIAVLSIGGIAGYSKAMEQYKLNKMANEYSFLIQGLMEHVEQLTKTSAQNPENMIGLANFAEAAEMVPATWKRRGSNQFIDSIGNQVALFLRDGQFVIEASMGGSAAMNDEHKYMNESFSLRMCETYLKNVVQPLHSVVHHAFFIRWQQGWTTLFGDRNCSAEGKCLRDLTPADINTICSSCNKNIGSCSVGMQFD